MRASIITEGQYNVATLPDSLRARQHLMGERCCPQCGHVLRVEDSL